LKEAVRAKLDRSLVNEIIRYTERKIEEKQTRLWGEVRPDGFEQMCVYIALYKDLTGIGYTALAVKIKGWLRITAKSLRNNQRKIRRILKEWAESVITLGTLAERRAAARRVKFKKPVEGITLRIDSTDVPLAGIRTVSIFYPLVLA